MPPRFVWRKKNLTFPHLASSQPHLRSPPLNLTFPQLTFLHLPFPHLPSPHLTFPHLTSPSFTFPHLPSPHLTLHPTSTVVNAKRTLFHKTSKRFDGQPRLTDMFFFQFFNKSILHCNLKNNSWIAPVTPTPKQTKRRNHNRPKLSSSSQNAVTNATLPVRYF